MRRRRAWYSSVNSVAITEGSSSRSHSPVRSAIRRGGGLDSGGRRPRVLRCSGARDRGRARYPSEFPARRDRCGPAGRPGREPTESGVRPVRLDGAVPRRAGPRCVTGPPDRHRVGGAPPEPACFHVGLDGTDDSRPQLLGRDAPFVDQLVQHREVIERGRSAARSKARRAGLAMVIPSDRRCMCDARRAVL